MTSLITAVLSLLQVLAPNLGLTASTSGLVTQVIAVLVELTPVAIQEAKDLLPMIKNIITVLKSDPSTTTDQLTQLRASEALIDAAFDEAAAAAEAEDASVKSSG